MTFVLPSTTDLSFGCRVNRMPSGTPTATASSMETPTSHKCSPVSMATSRLCVSRKFKLTPSVSEHLLSCPKDSGVLLCNRVQRVQEFSGWEHAAQPSRFHQ